MERFHNTDLGIFFVRLATGIVFANAGWAKVSNMGMVVGFFSAMGIPAWLAYVVGYAELVGGIAYILGLGVRYVGAVLSVIMAVAIFKVHLANGYSLQNNGYEYVLVLLLASLALVCLGGGKYSVQQLFKKPAA